MRVRIPIKGALEQVGIDTTELDKFIADHGMPPTCYERRQWWLKALDRQFGIGERMGKLKSIADWSK